MLDPHRPRAVMDFLQRNAITIISWQTRSPDLYLFENVWDILGRRVCQRHPPVKTFAELSVAMRQD